MYLSRERIYHFSSMVKHSCIYCVTVQKNIGSKKKVSNSDPRLQLWDSHVPHLRSNRNCLPSQSVPSSLFYFNKQLAFHSCMRLGSLSFEKSLTPVTLGSVTANDWIKRPESMLFLRGFNSEQHIGKWEWVCSCLASATIQSYNPQFGLQFTLEKIFSSFNKIELLVPFNQCPTSNSTELVANSTPLVDLLPTASRLDGGKSCIII